MFEEVFKIGADRRSLKILHSWPPALAKRGPRHQCSPQDVSRAHRRKS